MICLLGTGEVQRAFFHLICHEIQGVRPRRCEVLFQAGAVDEAHIRGQDIVRRFAIENPDKKCDHSFGDE